MVNPWIFTSLRFPVFARPLMVESLIEIVTWYSGHNLKNYLFDPSNCCHHSSRYYHQEAWRLTSDIYLLTKNHFITVSLQLTPLHGKIELLSLNNRPLTLILWQKEKMEDYTCQPFYTPIQTWWFKILLKLHILVARGLALVKSPWFDSMCGCLFLNFQLYKALAVDPI